MTVESRVALERAIPWLCLQVDPPDRHAGATKYFGHGSPEAAVRSDDETPVQWQKECRRRRRQGLRHLLPATRHLHRRALRVRSIRIESPSEGLDASRQRRVVL